MKENKSKFLNRGKEENKKRSRVIKIEKLYAVYVITMLSFFTMVICFIIHENFYFIKASDVNVDFLIHKIAAHVVSSEFMDLSMEENIDISVKDDFPDDEVPNSDSQSQNAKPVIKEEDNANTTNGEGIPIVPLDLSLVSFGSDYILNETGYSPNVAELLLGEAKREEQQFNISVSDAPIVLILHTHTTESYCEDGVKSYVDTGNEFARSDEENENMIAVGNVFAQILNQNGIPAIHCTVVHDNPQYKNSYYRAQKTIEYYLEKYPSIQLVIDIHRDSILKSNGDIVRPVTEVEGEALAQIMFVVGSDYGGEACPNWENNLSLALRLREDLNDKYFNLCRPVSLKSSTYNQEIASSSLLIEIGATGNSIEEAKRSAVVVAESLATLLKNNSQ